MPGREPTSMMRGIAIVIVLIVGLVGTTNAKPQRVVSINLCTDQLVVTLADPARIVSLYRTSADPSFSYVADRLPKVVYNRGLAEEVLVLKPDLVIAGVFTTRATVAILRRHDIPVIELPLIDSFAAVRQQVMHVATALGEEARGRSLLDDMDRRLERVAHVGPRRPALLVGSGLFTNGQGTLLDEALTAAGLENVAARRGVVGFSRIGLEQLLAAAPDVVIIPDDPQRRPSLSAQLLRHPALGDLARRRTVVSIPAALWSCGGPFIVEAVERLAEAAR